MLDVQQSLAIAAEASKSKWIITDEKLKAKSPPKDFAVPNFGVDVDIKDAQENIAESEKVLNHKWADPENDGQYWAV